jgi:pimeloyl-ACP methyl ester carboxylesterase
MAPVETEDLAEEIEKVFADAPGPVLLAAHSYGGNVALRVAMRGQVEISRMILFEPVEMPALKIAGDHAGYRAAKAVFDSYIAQFEGGDRNAVATMIDYWFGAGAFHEMPANVQDYLRANTAVNVRDVQAGFRQSLNPEHLAALDMPVTVVYGTRSPDITRKIANALADHLQAGSVKSLEDATHAMLSTHPKQVASLIENGAVA